MGCDGRARSGLPQSAVPAEGRGEGGRRALGSHRRQWWAPPGADLALFGRWIDPEPRQFAGRPVAVRVVQLPEACWKCGASSRPIVGVVLRKRWAAYPDGFVDFGECGEAILASVSADQLADNHVGPIEWRRTTLVPEGSWANTCPYCSATFGNFPLYEGLLDAYNEGVERRQLPGFWVALPVDAFQSDEDYWAQETYENGWDEDEAPAPAPTSEEQADSVRVRQAGRAPADAPVRLATRLRRRIGRS